MTRQRVTVADAARLLGVSQDAVRMRVKRGKLEADKEGNRLFVWLDTDPTADPTADRDELLEAYRDQIEFLRRELERKDAILLRMAERLPELEAPASPGPSETPTGATEQPGRVEPQPSVEGAQEPAQPRRAPWWRRVFGG